MNKAFATIFMRNLAQPSYKDWTPQNHFSGKTKQEAATLAQNVQKGLVQGQGWEYEIHVGEYTHMVEPPKPPILNLIEI